MTPFSASGSLLVLCLMGWGVILMLCLFLALMRAFFSCVQRRYNGEAVIRRSGQDRRGENYRTMSPERQEEIDNLRKNALLRYMRRFTLTLGDEHLICCSGSQTGTTLSISESEEVGNESVTSDESCQDMEGSSDIEEGSKDVVQDRGDMAQDSKVTAAGDAAVEYTHISIPVPGCDVTGIDISTALEKRRENRRRWKLPFLFQTGKDNRNGKETSQIEKNATNNKTQQNDQQKVDKMVEKRNVPIFCAICLSEYDKGDGVCWSSNAECSHVFHEDCILQWLISSGKKRAMSQYFTKHPTDAKLLENEFCPCCRQEFICVNPALIGSEENV